MVRLECPVVGCDRGKDGELGGVWMTEEVCETVDQAQKSLEMHLLGHSLSNLARGQGQAGRVPKSTPPKLEMGISNQEWEYFLGKWDRHKNYCGLEADRDLVYNLWQCMSIELERAATDDGMNKPEFNTEKLFLA